jgi:ABC-type Zn uptake system ZnuABC Zn-binding protein ZnuA
VSARARRRSGGGSHAPRVAEWFTAWAAVACAALVPSAAQEAQQAQNAQELQEARTADETVVLTALPVLYSMARALTEGTSTVVRNLPETGRPMSSLESYFTLQAERLAPEFESAEAVITIGKLWRDDPLYVAAREANIRIVEIDATKPWSTTLEGVALALEPVDNVPWADGAGSSVGESKAAGAARGLAVYYWLSPANGAQAADIVARDLMRLAPRDAPRIAANLAAFRARVLDLKRRYEIELAALSDVTVFALTRDLVYLTTDLSLYVDGYFTKQDIHWTADDASALTERLRDRGIRVVLHRWEPAEPIAAAIAAAGAQLVVLEVGDVGDPSMSADGALAEDGYLRLLETDLEALARALRSAEPGQPPPVPR